jgi:hypothetical protein
LLGADGSATRVGKAKRLQEKCRDFQSKGLRHHQNPIQMMLDDISNVFSISFAETLLNRLKKNRIE